MFPLKKDWVLQVQDDLEKCQIHLSDDEISNLKKRKFKSIVLKSIHELTTDHMTKFIDKPSKSENLYPSDTMQDYLVNLNTTVKEKKLLFLLRSRMFPVKMNYQQKYSNLLCSLCSRTEESQEHLLACEEIVNEEELKLCLMRKNVLYRDIFGPPSKQTESIKIWSVVENIWRKRLKAKELQE